MIHNLVLLQGLNEFLTGSKQVVAGPRVLLVVELHVFPVHLARTIVKPRMVIFITSRSRSIFSIAISLHALSTMLCTYSWSVLMLLPP